MELLQVAFPMCERLPSSNYEEKKIFNDLGLHYEKIYACNCKHCILYPLQLGPPFLNDDSTLKPKVSLGTNQMKNDLRKVFMENITYF